MKDLLTKALQISVPILPFSIWQRLWGENLFLPFYHLVSDESPPHVRHLYPVRSVQQFREDLDFLLKHFQPIDLQLLWEYVFEKRPFERPVFHLTFDDGLRECHDVILPILLEKGIPASFFLNPDFVDNRDLMFRYKASLLYETKKTLPADPLKIKYENRHLLDLWAGTIGLDFSAFLAEQKPYLTTAQIQTMQARGFTMGAHSLDHPQYEQIPADEQIRQTVESLSEVKSRFGVTHNTFAFPFTDDGVGMDFFNLVPEKIGGPLLSFGSAGAKKDSVPTHLQRFAMERTTLPAGNVVSAALAASVLRKILRKNTVCRKHLV